MTALLDDIDLGLLRLLAEDARLPISELARRLGIARSTAQQRVQRLEARKVILGYTIRIAPMATSLVVAHVDLTVNPKLSERVIFILEQIPEVLELHAVSGPFDLVAIVHADSPQAMDELLDHISRLQGIERTVSSVVLATKVSRAPEI
jgi:DNA-binding Lrp family transcriptional regulator